MTITYELQDNLYINVTNKCPNACDFCVRNLENAFEHDLWLQKDPTASEIISEVFSRDLSKYKQVVFCGFGEPLENIDEVIEVSKVIKEKLDIKIRINTNGLANKIHAVDVTPSFKKLIDSVSISLNAKNAEEYDAICHSIYGKGAFYELLDFARKCKANVKEVQLSVVDCLPKEDIEACEEIANSIGIKLKVRKEVK
jgi:TatD family-associated radical SAM protein